MAREASLKYIKGRQELARGTITSSNVQMEWTDADRKGLRTWAHLTGRHETMMTQAIGVKNIPYRVEAEAKIAFGDGKYEFIFLVDVSPSMGIGASTSDRQIMQRAIGCQFACHEPWTSTVDRAHAAGARLRIDVVKDALKSLVTQLEEVEDIELKTALYSFSNHLHIKTGLQDGIATFKSQANNIGIHREYLRGGGTNYNGVFKEFAQVMQDLKPRSDVKQHVIILSDATSHHNLKSASKDHIWNKTPNYIRYGGTFNPRWCQFLQEEENRTVHTMWVDPGDTNADYEGSMRACATSGEFFYKANSAAEIDKAFKELFENILKSVYLSS